MICTNYIKYFANMSYTYTHIKSCGCIFHKYSKELEMYGSNNDQSNDLHNC